MAIAEWYSQRIYWNVETGLPIDEENEVKAREFVQVVYQDT